MNSSRPCRSNSPAYDQNHGHSKFKYSYKAKNEENDSTQYGSSEEEEVLQDFFPGQAVCQDTQGLNFCRSNSPNPSSHLNPYPEQRRPNTTTHYQTASATHSQKTCKNKVKVELCRNFVSQGYCPYGSKCRFAHGLHELLQNTELNFNFRTKNCKTFYFDGECRFGERCNFKHDDRKLETIQREYKASLTRSHLLMHYPEVLLLRQAHPEQAKSRLFPEDSA